MLNFYEITAEEIMTPRVEVDALDYEITVDEAIDKMMNFSHSRILVYKENIDNIKRVIRLRQLLIAQKK
jgi:CBS domain containing-hemolysin-like protein